MKKLSLYLMLAFAGLFMTACGPEDNEFAGLKTAVRLLLSISTPLK